MIFGGKRRNVEELLERYFERSDEAFQRFSDGFTIYIEEGLGPAFDAAVQAVHESESKCDDQRREIEYLLYGKALLPESRGDLLGLLETWDRLPNIAEAILFMLSGQAVVLPEDMVGAFRELVAVNLEAYRLARRCIDALLSNPRSVLHETAAVDHKESESDRIERRMIRDIFSRNLSPGQKLIYKDAVLLVGEISDRAERAADRVAIIAIKRQV